MALGTSAEQITVTGTIKTLAPPLGCDLAELHAWQQAAGHRPIWVLASSHPGEETLALSAHQQLLRHQPDALLIIAPRARDRGPEVTKNCPSGCRLRSAHEPLEATTSVYVADTIGEMGLWYRLAPIALMGGSFAEVGGHNPHEPLALDCRVLHGPNVWNFSESYANLDAQGLALQVSNSTDIAQAVLAEWKRSPLRTQASGQENQALVCTLIRLAQRS
jgi:3-deoxy-D-manno-octulosonic-acid transferase